MKLTKNQKLWISALQNGMYAQTKEHLRDEIGFCCLGVACDLYEKDTGVRLPRNGCNENNYAANTLFSVNHFSNVFDWLGLKSVVSQDILIKLNDGSYNNEKGEYFKSHTFQQIAEKVLSDPSTYFKVIED